MGNLVEIISVATKGIYVPLGMIDDLVVVVEPSVLENPSNIESLKLFHVYSIESYKVLNKRCDINKYRTWYAKNMLIHNWPKIDRENIVEYLRRDFTKMEIGVFYYSFITSPVSYVMKLDNQRFFTMPESTFNVFLKRGQPNSFLDGYLKQIKIDNIRNTDKIDYVTNCYKSYQTNFKYELAKFF